MCVCVCIPGLRGSTKIYLPISLSLYLYLYICTRLARVNKDVLRPVAKHEQKRAKQRRQQKYLKKNELKKNDRMLKILQLNKARDEIVLN